MRSPQLAIYIINYSNYLLNACCAISDDFCDSCKHLAKLSFGFPSAVSTGSTFSVLHAPQPGRLITRHLKTHQTRTTNKVEEEISLFFELHAPLLQLLISRLHLADLYLTHTLNQSLKTLYSTHPNFISTPHQELSLDDLLASCPTLSLELILLSIIALVWKLRLFK